MIRFQCLASGSSGNCYFLGTTERGILIDAGIGMRSLVKGLRELGIELSQIHAVLITHDHADHVKSVGCLAQKHHLPVYATAKVHQAIAASRYLEEIPVDRCFNVAYEEPFDLLGFRITPFAVPHDASDNVGYSIAFDEHRLTIATDVGHLTDDIERYMSLSTHLVIEANYDEEMLRQGSYPAFLRQRIVSPTGHLSNRETAEFLVRILRPEMKSIWLCHLSRDNNHPELAYKTVEMTLRSYGIVVGKDVRLTTLKRTHPSDLYVFE